MPGRLRLGLALFEMLVPVEARVLESTDEEVPDAGEDVEDDDVAAAPEFGADDAVVVIVVTMLITQARVQKIAIIRQTHRFISQ